jgi:hypothetical protein
MTVIRLYDGGIWIHSPVALKDALGEDVAALGPVRHLIAPNWIHYSWISPWQDQFSPAITWGSPGVVARAASQGTKLRIDHELGDAPLKAWDRKIAQRLADSGFHREVVFFHRESRTLVLTDLIMNFEAGKMPWWARPILRLGGVCDPDGRVPRDIAASFRRRPGHLRDLADTMIGWAPELVVLAQGRWYARDGTAELRRVFRRLLPAVESG